MHSLWRIPAQAAVYRGLVLQCVICSLHSYNGMLTCITNAYLLIDPSKVTGVFSTIIETTSLNVSWTIPQSDMTITQYQVQYRTKEATSWNSCPPVSGSPPATSTVVNGLKSGFEYKVRVRAWSAVGAGNWSDERTPCCKFFFGMHLRLSLLFMSFILQLLPIL